MMRRLYTITTLVLCSLFVNSLIGQVAINRNGAAPDASSALEITSSQAGFLMPRLTGLERIALSTPADGLIVYQTTNPKGFYYAQGGNWNLLNADEPYRNEVTMNSPGAPIVSPNGSFGSQGFVVNNIEVGVVEVLHANFPNPPVKTITPVFVEIPSPPTIPDDLCVTSFTNNCGQSGGGATFQHALIVGVISPPSLGNTSNPLEDFRLCKRWGSGNLCNNNAFGDYRYYGQAQLPLSFKCTFLNVAPNNVPYNNTSGIDPGDDFELLLRGNTQTASNRWTALSVFVDWNQDADFFDAGEAVYASSKELWSTSYRGTGELRGPFTVPANAVDGTCTMRVIASKVDDNPLPCLITAEGSAQDFEFHISNGAAPSYPAENIHCNYSEETNSSFKVRCYDDAGSPVNAKVHILIQN